MIKKIIYFFGCMLVIAAGMMGCASQKDTVKIGVSFGAGPAVRWDFEKDYMEERAEELGIEIEVILNRQTETVSQEEDCRNLIDSGIDVLILMLKDASEAETILKYAEQKNVPVISYARVILEKDVDLFVGYDSGRIGQKMGQFLTELVYEGDYIILQGDSTDNNAKLLYEGAMRYIEPIQENINIVLDEPVKGWDPEEAKRMLKEAISSNGNHVDAILAPNDKIAGACAEVLEEMGITEHVAITGMDAELDAVYRILEGTQDMTVYMDLRELATTAVNEAYHMATGQKVNVNAKFDNQSEDGIDANLITGQVVSKENIDKVLIESGYYTEEEIYGKNEQ